MLRRAVFCVWLRRSFWERRFLVWRADSAAARSVFSCMRVKARPVCAQIDRLNFDAGDDSDGIPELLAELDRSQTPATFFVTAQRVQRYPAYAEMLASERTLWTAIRGITAILPACPTMKPALIFSDRLPPSRDDSGRPPACSSAVPMVSAIRGLCESYRNWNTPISWTVDSLGRTAKGPRLFYREANHGKTGCEDGWSRHAHALRLAAGDGCSGGACDCRFNQRHFESVTTDERIRTKSSHRWFIN